MSPKKEDGSLDDVASAYRPLSRTAANGDNRRATRLDSGSIKRGVVKLGFAQNVKNTSAPTQPVRDHESEVQRPRRPLRSTPAIFAEHRSPSSTRPTLGLPCSEYKESNPPSHDGDDFALAQKSKAKRAWAYSAGPQAANSHGNQFNFQQNLLAKPSTASQITWSERINSAFVTPSNITTQFVDRWERTVAEWPPCKPALAGRYG